jgi:hypothetical protein
MRVLVLTIAFLAFPALAIAQQAAQEAGDVTSPRVELQQSTPSSPAADVVGAGTGAEDADVQPVTGEASAADAAAQAGDPTTARWWWLVAAIVVAGVVLAALL